MLKRTKIHNQEVAYKCVYRDIKHPRLEFKTGNLLLVLPKDFKQSEEDVIHRHKKWIYQKNKEILNAIRKSQKSQLLKARDKETFKESVAEIKKKYLKELNLEAGVIIFRTMKSKWASCSSRQNLTINTLLRYLPSSLIDYVVYHEITHLIEREHNDRFWKIVGKRFKHYAKHETDLLTYWFLLQREVKS